MKEGKESWKDTVRNGLSILPATASTMMIIIRQVYYPETDTETIINFLLLAMSWWAFLLLLKSVSNGARVFSFCCMAYINIQAFLFNVSYGDVPSPLTDLPSFLNSMCGVWLIMSLIELLAPLAPWLRKVYHSIKKFDPNPLEECEPGSEKTRHRKDAPFGTDDTVGKETDGPEFATSTPGHSDDTGGKPGSKRRKKYFSLGAKTAPIAFLLIALLLPLLPWPEHSRWYSNIKNICQVVFGSSITNQSSLVILIFYFAFMFAAFITLYIAYVIATYIWDQIKYRPSEPGTDIFGEYSSAIALLVVAWTGMSAARYTVHDGKGASSNLISMITPLFELMFQVIIGIIVVFIMFETARLILEQCVRKGTLLKTSMHLIYVLVVQYAVGLLMGILRIFAIRNAIESILLFFFPDLDSSIEERIHKVFNHALEREVRGVAQDSEIRFEDEHQKRIKKSGRRVWNRKGWR